MARHDEELVKFMCVVSENMVQTFFLHRQLYVVTESHVDHSGVWLAMDEDQFPKVTIGGNQNTPFHPGKPQYVWIGQSALIVRHQAGGIMPKPVEICSQAGVRTLVQQESQPLPRAHPQTDRDELTNLRWERFRFAFTAAWA